MKNISFIWAGLIAFNVANSQQNPATLGGEVTEKANAQLQLFKIINNKPQKIGDYTINPSHPEFVFVLPADTVINYRLQLTTLKQGHIRLEADKSFTLPLTLKPGQSYSLKLTPSKLDEAKKTGFELKEGVAKSPIAYVGGKFVNWKFGANISIQRVVDGAYEAINGIGNSKDNTFLLSCVVRQEGFYYLSSLRWKLRVYLKPGDNLELAIDGMSGSYEVINGSDENRSVQKWQQLIYPITKYGYNSTMLQKDSIDLADYQKAYEGLESSIVNFRSNISHTNPEFQKRFRMAIDVDKDFAPILFLLNASAKRINGFRTTPRDFNTVPAFYKRFVQPGKLRDASILNIGEAKQYMSLYTKLVIASLPAGQKQLTREDKLGVMIRSISNDTLKSYFFKDQLSEIEINNLTEFRSTFEPYKKYATIAPVKKKYIEVYQSFIGDTAYVGKSAYNFSLPDSAGRMISMEEFKGKVVLIDVWATWCGPCREQFPFLKELEEEYRDNKDIVFLGISIDRATDRQKWLNMKNKENLPPLQLLDDMGKSFAGKYGIAGIPRFLLVSKEGKWIEVRCPRPEDKEGLRRYLDKALQQNAVSNSTRK